MSKASRKPRPSMPRWYWLDQDGCWYCQNKNNCNSCKAIRSYVKDRKIKKPRDRMRGMGNQEVIDQ